MTTEKRFDSLCYFKQASLFLLPSCIVYFAMALRKASGPFWQGNFFEAEYSYLMNSLAVSQGMQVLHADHPGSTLQLLGGFLLYLSSMFADMGSVVSDVLVRPESYIYFLYYSLLSFLFVLLYAAGYLVLKYADDYVAAIIIQGALLLSYSVSLYSLPRMKPEMLILIIDVLLYIVIIYHYHLYLNSVGKDPWWQYGASLGFGIALKITVAPLVIIPLLLINGVKKKFAFVAVCLFVFFSTVANPLMNFAGFKKFLFGHLVARQGYNRPIVEGSNLFEAMNQGMGRLFHFLLEHEKFLLVLLVFFLFSGAIYFFSSGRKKDSMSDLFCKRLWVGLLLVIVCQFLYVANGPSAKSHYIVPATGLIGLVAFVAWTWPVAVLKYRKVALFCYKFAYLSLFIAGSIWVGMNIPSRIHGLEKESAKWLESYNFRKENNLLDIPTIYYYRASSVQYALAFGNELSGKQFSKQLTSYYPECFSFHIWSRLLYGNFGDEIVQLNDIVKRYGRVLIQGENVYPPLIAGLEEDAYPATKQRHYRLSGAVIPVAANESLSSKVLFNGSKEWLVMVEPGKAEDYVSLNDVGGG